MAFRLLLLLLFVHSSVANAIVEVALPTTPVSVSAGSGALIDISVNQTSASNASFDRVCKIGNTFTLWYDPNHFIVQRCGAVDLNTGVCSDESPNSNPIMSGAPIAGYHGYRFFFRAPSSSESLVTGLGFQGVVRFTMRALTTAALGATDLQLTGSGPLFAESSVSLGGGNFDCEATPTNTDTVSITTSLLPVDILAPAPQPIVPATAPLAADDITMTLKDPTNGDSTIALVAGDGTVRRLTPLGSGGQKVLAHSLLMWSLPVGAIAVATLETGLATGGVDAADFVIRVTDPINSANPLFTYNLTSSHGFMDVRAIAGIGNRLYVIGNPGPGLNYQILQIDFLNGSVSGTRIVTGTPNLLSLQGTEDTLLPTGLVVDPRAPQELIATVFASDSGSCAGRVVVVDTAGGTQVAAAPFTTCVPTSVALDPLTDTMYVYENDIANIIFPNPGDFVSKASVGGGSQTAVFSATAEGSSPNFSSVFSAMVFNYERGGLWVPITSSPADPAVDPSISTLFRYDSVSGRKDAIIAITGIQTQIGTAVYVGPTGHAPPENTGKVWEGKKGHLRQSDYYHACVNMVNEELQDSPYARNLEARLEHATPGSRERESAIAQAEIFMSSNAESANESIQDCIFLCESWTSPSPLCAGR